MINYRKLNVFDAPVDGIIHQANCFCTMGSGIARAIKEKFPEAYEADCKTKPGDKSKLGTYTFAEVSSKENKNLKYIFNVYGQYDFGLEKKKYTDYTALSKGVGSVFYFASKNNLKSIAIPYRIGCDRGGGDWNIVEKIFINLKIVYPSIDIYVCFLSK